jgi:molybdate transport system substrate-binding protein
VRRGQVARTGSILAAIDDMVRRSWLVLTSVLLTLTGCGTGGGTTTTAASTIKGDLLVSAAASLTDAFAEIERAFEASHRGVDVTFNFGGSSSLREQILEGAPVDVFASANTSNMLQVFDAGQVAGEPRTFALNRLQIAVPDGNPGGVAGLEDFGREELLIGLCAAGVPCGDFARELLANADVVPAVDTDEPDVRALLNKIALGELDAGIVYLTDVASSGGSVEGIDIPDDVNVLAEYPIAVLANAPNPEAAAAFVAFVLTEEGQAILARYGFASP